jgi:hypothetical protein
VATILRRIPIIREPSTLQLADGTAVGIKSDQLILWMSVTPSGLADFPLAYQLSPQ